MAKPTIRTTTSALVRVTVEVRTGTWGEGCKLDQVYQQATEDALGQLHRVLSKHGIRIVGPTSIKAVTTDTAVRNG
ncbi:hypothetical protein ACK1O1_04190 [Stenotrophomonas maltophilia]|uniref:hypothetical protein n=1 Tax=Stenotrophomonas maltophilia TaxID=40324 RepID=UPI003917218F